jgi:hypothetical protein
MGEHVCTFVLRVARRSSLTSPTCMDISTILFCSQIYIDTHSIRACIQLVKEALIPRVDTILHNRLHQRHQPIFATSTFVNL